MNGKKEINALKIFFFRAHTHTHTATNVYQKIDSPKLHARKQNRPGVPDEPNKQHTEYIT